MPARLLVLWREVACVVTRGHLCCDARCSRHAGSVAAHCSKAAMFASARPPCRQSTRTVSRHLSSHKHQSSMRNNSISTGRLCGDVFASESAAMHTGADGHANDFVQCLQSSTEPMRLDKTAYPKTPAYSPESIADCEKSAPTPQLSPHTATCSKTDSAPPRPWPANEIAAW